MVAALRTRAASAHGGAAPPRGGLQVRPKAVEGLGTLTVLCVAGGEPVPEVSLAVNGVTLHSERVLLLSTIIHNIIILLATLLLYMEDR